MIKKCKIFVSFIFLFSNFSLSLAADDDARKKAFLDVVNDEIKEVSRISQYKKHSDPVFLLRLAELNLEKARVLREDEEAKYRELPEHQRQKMTANERKRFYSASNVYFNESSKIASQTLKRFPKFNEKARIYYILGHNNKEWLNKTQAKNYFNNAMKASAAGSEIYLRSQLELANLHYDDGQYAKALPLYERTLKSNKKDKWYTRNAYNLAWCYFRTGKSSQAISILEEVISLGKDSNYIDLSYNASKDLPFFMASAGKYKETIAYLKTQGDEKDFDKLLFQTAERLSGLGRHTHATGLMADGLKSVSDPRLVIQARLDTLSNLEQFGKYDEHFKMIEELMPLVQKGDLSGDQKEQFLYQAHRVAALLQNQVAGKTYVKQPKVRQAKADLASAYFLEMAKIDGKAAYKDVFLAAEVHFAAQNFEKSLNLYSQVQKMATEQKDAKFMNSSLEGKMACIDKMNVGKGANTAQLKMVYLEVIAAAPTSEATNKIYQRLFNIYMQEKDLLNAEKTLLSYKGSFPKELPQHEAMLAKIMDYHKDKGDSAALNTYVLRIQKGEFKVNNDYLKKIKLYLASLKFQEVEKLTAKGSNVEALHMYHAIYRDPESTGSAKETAAFNIATLFHQIGDGQRTLYWVKEALKVMSPQNVVKFEKTFLLIASTFFDKRKFQESATIYENVLKILCPTKSRSKDLFFKNALIVSLAENKVERSQELLSAGPSCGIKRDVVDEMQIEVLEDLYNSGNLLAYAASLEKMEKNEKLWSELIPYMNLLSTQFELSAKPQEANNVKQKMLSLYKSAKAKKISLSSNSLDIIADLEMESFRKELQAFYQIKPESSVAPTFVEKDFNNALKNKLSQLEKATVRSNTVLGVGSGPGIVKIYRYLVEAYSKFAGEVLQYNPTGKPEEYVKGFKGSMNGIAVTLKKQAGQFELAAKNQIKKTPILSVDNSYFLNTVKDGIGVKYQYPDIVLMDRGGRR